MRSKIKSSVIIGIMTAALLTPTMHVSASVSRELNEEEKESGFYDEKGQPIENRTRPAINPEFDPDEDCNISYELKCIPGSEQSCFELKGYHNGEDNVCSPIECQEGYLSVDDLETGLCITPEECESDDMKGYGYVLLEDEGRCALVYYICSEPEHSVKDYCVEWREKN
jgi:hypothetical protein